MVLVSPYELGRQPFGLAQPAAWLREAGFHVECLDLSQTTLESGIFHGAGLVAIHLAMHTATRIAVEALPRIRALAPAAYLCVYGLYAKVNEHYLSSLGVRGVLGGEFEADLLDLATELKEGRVPPTFHRTAMAKIEFRVPDRRDLPKLSQYAQLLGIASAPLTIGFAEASRGCKHLCRHCPVVPVYEGRFRVVPIDVVLTDIDNQVARGARHISFGDPDFLNGPTHALRLVRRLHARHPDITYDATIKIEHLLAQAAALPELASTGCILVTSAVESVDDSVLKHLGKNHTYKDFVQVVQLMREAGIALAPTFVAFHPWSSVSAYRDLLKKLATLDLVENVPAVQLAIRLLVPQGSRLMQLPGFPELVDPFDPEMLGYPWKHRDPAVDRLQTEVQSIAEAGEQQNWSRTRTFEHIWTAVYRALGVQAPPLKLKSAVPVPHHSEPWYCCAEPTDQQLKSF